MEEEFVGKKNPRIVAFFKNIDQIYELLEGIVQSRRPLLNGERFLNDREVSKILGISRRTLQEWRNCGHISYITLRGKLLYRESDIEKMLASNYHKADYDVD